MKKSKSAPKTMPKRKVMKKPVKKKAQVHIMIEEPVAVRKEILNCALDTTRLAKEFHEINTLRERKLRTIKRLQKVLREIKLIEKQLSGQLPEYGISVSEDVKEFHEKKEEHKTKPVTVTTHSKVNKKTMPASKVHKSEADKLKDELREIEQRLKSL